VYNPVKIAVGSLREAVDAAGSAAGWSPSSWHETASVDGGKAAVLEALSLSPDVVLVVGGDGTLRVAAQILAGTGVPVAVIPGGTGNLFARNLGLHVTDLAASIATAFSGTERTVDVGRALLARPDGTHEEHAFLVMAGIGLDAHMAAHTDARLKRRFGWIAYSDPIARSVFGNRQIDLAFRVDHGPERSTRAHTVIVGNCGMLTAGVLLLPAARPDDGMLDAVALRPRGGVGWSKVGYGLATNRFLHRTRFGKLLHAFLPTSRTMRYVQARTLQMRVGKPEELQLDGDPFGTVVGVELTVSPRSLVVKVGH
jgi:diacylglycerol kinase family enzyme